MGGRPKLLALKKRIAEGDLEDDIFEAVAEGLAIGKVCEMFQITSRKMFYDWKGKEGPRHDKYTQARLIAAGAHAEKAGDELDALKDQVMLTGPEVAAATSRSKYQQWLASVKDRDQFGAQDKNPAVVLNFGELHFEALRSARPRQIVAPVQTLIPAEEHAEANTHEPYYEEIVGVGNDGEADAQSGHIEGPITPPAPDLAPELGDLL